MIQTSDQPQNRALPRPRAAHQGHEVSGLHGERQVIKDQFLPETLAEVVNDQFHGSHRPFAAETQQQPESHVDGEADQAKDDQLGENLIGTEKALSELYAFAEAHFRGH